MESLAIEECHGVLSEIATIPDRMGEDKEGEEGGGGVSSDAAFHGAREVTLNINYWLGADRT